MMLSNLVLTVALLSTVATIESYRILLVFTTPAKSHNILGAGMANALVDAGHEVVLVTATPPNEKRNNLRIVDMSFMFEKKLDVKPKAGPPQSGVVKILAHGFHVQALESEQFQSLLNDPNERFDAVITEWFFSDIYAGLAPLFECPWIVLYPFGQYYWIDYNSGELRSPAVYPSFLLPYSVPLNFWQRVHSTFHYVYSLFELIVYDRPRSAEAYDRLLKPIALKRGVILPSLEDAVKNSSFTFLNTHSAMSDVQKIPPNSAEVCGFHVSGTVPELPQDLQSIMDSSPGVIYFSMGSNVRSSDLSPEVLKELLEIFERLPYTIIWKYEVPLDNLPKNVHIRDWLPQQSILAHKNMKVFISHGGFLSITESVHHGVPLIAVPMFGDQFYNAKMGVRKGYALEAKFYGGHFAHNLEVALKEMLSNERYKKTVQHLSQIYHDRAVDPKKLIVHSVESTIRSGGAAHLRLTALAVPIYQQLLLDQIAFYIVIIILVLTSLKVIFIKCFGRRKENKTKME